LHGRLGDADIAGNLLAEPTARDLDHDFALPGAQRVETLLERGQALLRGPPGPIASKADLNGVEQRLLAEWLGQDLDGAAFIACTVIGISPCAVMKMIGGARCVSVSSR